MSDEEDDIDEEARPDEWARALVWQAAEKHVDLSLQCEGAIIVNDARATCGCCGWRISAHREHVGQERSAVFALFVLATVGRVVWLGEGMPACP